MSEIPENLDVTAREAIHAAKNAAQAREVARQAQVETAAQTAADRVAEKIVDEQRLGEIVHKPVTDVLSMGSEKERAVVLARVPYICQDIREINSTLSELRESLRYIPLIQILVFGLVGMIVVAVFGAMILLAVPHASFVGG